MTRYIVASVRATSLADALAWVVISGARKVDWIDEAIFQAQRLQSTCERNLGQRDRLVDQVREGRR